ncbi:hypothetical protein RND81_12G130100 [Saponaria officinalis]|uniref:Endonuclease/exonuclease/phosphatase domain-containing protein n=1 Tax=Saponaria officinalis TaxID=3572 RepID=A0AAW1H9W7_SAPOF
MIEVDVAQVLPEFVLLNSPYTGHTAQRIVYEWVPYYCKTCKKLGHTEGTCRNNKKKDEVKKVDSQVGAQIDDPIVVDGACESVQPCSDAASGSHLLGEYSVPGHQSEQVCADFREVSGRKVVKVGGVAPTSVFSPNIFNALSVEEGLEVHSEVAGFLAGNKVDFCGLLETRVKQSKAASILRKSLSNYSSFCNYSSHYNGRIWLIWHSGTTQVTVLEEHPQVVHCHIKHFATNREFHVSVVYGSNNATVRQDLWASLSGFAASVGPWIVMGDFNVIRQDSGRAVYSKLDRVMINVDWCRKRFSFLNCWADHAQFHNIVANAWRCDVRGTPMFRLMGKLRNVKKGLKLLHKHKFAGIGERVQQRKDDLATCYTALMANPLSEALIQREKQASIAYWKLKEAEAKILSQRAKIHDMKHGDTSSRYFFTKIKERHQAQVIGVIHDYNGLPRLGLHQVGEAFVEYYQHLLGSSIPVKAIDQAVVSNGKVLDSSDFAGLIRPVTRAEIKSALFAIDSNKSPGMDGYSSGFFKAAWDIIQPDFCSVVEDFSEQVSCQSKLMQH